MATRNQWGIEAQIVHPSDGGYQRSWFVRTRTEPTLNKTRQAMSAMDLILRGKLCRAGKLRRGSPVEMT